MSSGRCSTQSITKQLIEAQVDATVEHEPIGWEYSPRIVFRNRDRCAEVIAQSATLARKLDEIDQLVFSGGKYISTGWPTFAWADHFAERWNHKVHFVGLVRQPFEFAASPLTHRFFLGRDDGYQSQAIIHGHDENIHFKGLRE